MGSPKIISMFRTVLGKGAVCSLELVSLVKCSDRVHSIIYFGNICPLPGAVREFEFSEHGQTDITSIIIHE